MKIQFKIITDIKHYITAFILFTAVAVFVLPVSLVTAFSAGQVISDMPVSNMESFSDLLSEKTEGRGQLAEQHPLSNDGGSSDSALLPEDPQHELP